MDWARVLLSAYRCSSIASLSTGFSRLPVTHQNDISDPYKENVLAHLHVSIVTSCPITIRCSRWETPVHRIETGLRRNIRLSFAFSQTGKAQFLFQLKHIVLQCWTIIGSRPLRRPFAHKTSSVVSSLFLLLGFTKHFFQYFNVQGPCEETIGKDILRV